MRIAVSAAVFALALGAGARTHWTSVSRAAALAADERAFAAAALGRTGPDATGAELIDAAVSRGELGSEYGLLYGVYLACDPARLPAEYRGQPAGPVSHDVLREADVDWPSLSAPVRGALRQFFAAALAGDAAAGCAAEIRQLAGQPDIWWTAALRGEPRDGRDLAYSAGGQ